MIYVDELPGVSYMGYLVIITRIIHKNMYARFELYSIAYIIMFSGGELCATDEPARDLSDLCVCNTTLQRLKGCIAFDLSWG